MNRFEIIKKIGERYLDSNLENGEFSYPKALKEIGKSIDATLISSARNTKHSYLDIRFVDGQVSILVETKNNFDKWNTEETLQQLQAYVNYEKELTNNKIVAILANTQDDRIKVWWGSDLIIDESHRLGSQYVLKSFAEYANLFTSVQNDKELVIKNTYALNELLHKHGIGEKQRSQFVGTCLLSLKNGLAYERLSAKQILGGIEESLENLLNKDLNKAEKLVILKNKILSSQDIRDLKGENLQEILRRIQTDILPYINDKNTAGQDILNLFFTTFNKYVGKADKNQAFTPDHIVQFMCQLVGISRNSKVLDPCCGSGAFLVRAMTQAIDDCDDIEAQEKIKRNSIFGIEFEETAFGLATTNMLIHGDGNSNIYHGNCFEKMTDLCDKGIDVVLMNPPYNAQRKHSKPDYMANWEGKTTQDPSKGFHYVHYVASIVKKGKLAVLLPMQCAIGKKGAVQVFKEKMLEEHTLDAVFSLPSDVFHPGAGASVCCMIFNLGVRHERAIHDTFFGYFKDDGFIKKKKLGRVEKRKENSNEGVWADIQAEWLSLYRGRKKVAGLSVTKKVTADDEWLAEAYMDTDYSHLTDDDFEKVIRQYLAFKIEYNLNFMPRVLGENVHDIYYKIETTKWVSFDIKSIFSSLEKCRCNNANLLLEDGDDIFYIGAKKATNGVMSRVKCVDDLVTRGNCIVFICDGQGSVGYSNYIEQDFIGSTTLTSGYSEYINKYTGLFLVTVLDLERPKYSFGRKYGKLLPNTKIKLPVTPEGKPDWQFMEDHIKSLPYSANL